MQLSVAHERLGSSASFDAGKNTEGLLEMQQLCLYKAFRIWGFYFHVKVNFDERTQICQVT